MVCKQCGCEIIEGSRFCENCGTKIETETPVQAEQPAAAPVTSAPEAPAAPAATVAPEAPAAPVTQVPAAPSFQPIPVTPVYAPNSVYAQNAAAYQAQQQAMVQPAPIVPAQQYPMTQQYPVVQQTYMPAVQMPQYQVPAYAQQYTVNAANSTGKRNIFSRILMIISIVTTVIFGLVALIMLLDGVTSGSAPTLIGLLAVGGFSVFTLVFSISKKDLSKGLFIGLLIPLCVISYIVYSVAGDL